jgi:hypothetical protein
MMKFIGFPESHEDAINIAASMAGFLQEWYREGAQPIIIMEPTFNGGQDMMDLKAFSKGDYDGALNTFFATLKELGVTDKDMGTWTPFPESNTPTWEGGITDPKLFISNTTKAAKTCKQYFPTTPVSVMLDSQTFLPSPDPNWANGTMNPNALLQYLNFESGLIDSFGLQGFTWDDRDNPATYLSAKAAIAGAKQLGVKNVWFNTGTYSVVNNPNGEGIIKSSNKRRAQVLDEVLAQVLNVQNSGLKVDYINIFGQDTFEGSSTGTGTANYQYDTPEATVVLKEFVKSAEEHQIPVTIFDAT